MNDPIGNVKELLTERLYGKEYVAESRRKRELEHERQLAVIRAQSHALIWRGTAEELAATIARWFESGWIVAASAQDALRMASIHFVRPDGTPVIGRIPPAAPPQTAPDAATNSNPRKTFVLPLLEKKGWSILDWANEARVSHATALDFLAGKTKPYRSTRLKLAKVLGVTVQELPR